MGHIFISHGSEDRDEAAELCAFIESHGVKAWIAPRDVRPGGDYSEELQAAIESCVAFVVLVTEMANKSPYVRAETEMAFSNSKPIFPVRASDIKPAAGLAFFLKIRHWTDAFGEGREASMARLALELQTLGGVAPASKSAPPPAPAPAPAAAAPSTPATPAPAPDEVLLAAAIGPNSKYYIEHWRRIDETGAKTDWNWAACFANLYWLAYRRLWPALVLFLIANLVLAMLGSATPTAARITLILTIGLTFVTGAFGNLWYRKQAARLIAATAGMDRDAALAHLRAKGGVSRRAVWIAIGVSALLVALAGAGAVMQARQQLQLEQLRQQQLRDHDNALQAAEPADQVLIDQQEPAEQSPPPAEDAAE